MCHAPTPDSETLMRHTIISKNPQYHWPTPSDKFPQQGKCFMPHPATGWGISLYRISRTHILRPPNAGACPRSSSIHSTALVPLSVPFLFVALRHATAYRPTISHGWHPAGVIRSSFPPPNASRSFFSFHTPTPRTLSRPRL